MTNIAQTRFGQIVIGPPGSGKTTYVGAMAELLRLFLVDVRIDYDSWRGSPVVTSNSRTVITVNPNSSVPPPPRPVQGLLRLVQVGIFIFQLR